MTEWVDTSTTDGGEMRSIKGDLVELADAGQFDVIVHGCNCQCVMGAGIAKAIRKRFPAAYAADQTTQKGDSAKLGTITVAAVQASEGPVHVVNAYTQFHYGRRKGGQLDYDALRTAFSVIKQRFSGKRIGYPKIGAGLAGGDWSRIAEIIDHELAGEDHMLVEYAAD